MGPSVLSVVIYNISGTCERCQLLLEDLLVVLYGKQPGSLAEIQLQVNIPLDTREREQTSGNTGDDLVVPALVPVLVGEEADSAEDSDVDWG
jgi:hypothetical protein